MSEPTIICDQAIFTSVRTPTGEGYRIIAASSGIKADERRRITRNAPSHGSLCRTADASAIEPGASVAHAASEAPYAISFYELTDGRSCVGLSLGAGAEQSGRGGARVYTHIVAFDAEVFARFMFNPFSIARAMVAAGLDEPQLKPPARLPQLVLTIPVAKIAGTAGLGSINAVHGANVLERLFEERVVVVHADDGWIEAAEALWLSLPGPFRSRLSLSAGLKFSTGRSHNLQLLSDDKGAARTRVVGQRAEYIDTTCAPAAECVHSGGGSVWQAFVQRHWSQGDWDGLARRTSLAFGDITPAGRDRVGQLYNTLDDLPRFESMRLISTASEYLRHEADGTVERGIVKDLLGAIQSTLSARVATVEWPADEPLWKAIIRLWRGGEREVAFADPLVACMLRGVSALEPLEAAEMALDTAGESPPGVDHDKLQTVVVEVLARWGAAVDRMAAQRAAVAGASADIAEIEPRLIRSRAVAERWKRLRPDCAIVSRIVEHCDECLSPRCAAKG